MSTFPMTLPALTVYGRLGIGDGPGEAIPFATLGAQLVGTETTVNDVNYAVIAADRTIVYTALSAARTVTLLAATTYRPGTKLYFLDRSGNANATRTISLAPTGADTINGANATLVTINGPYALYVAETDGISKWSVGLQLFATSSPTLTGNWTFSPTSGDALTVNPPPSSLSRAFTITQTVHGTGTANTANPWNYLFIQSDDAVITGSTGEAYGSLITHNFGPSSVSASASTLQGARSVFGASGSLSAPSSASNSLKQYIGIKSSIAALEPDGGTNTGAGALGAIYGYYAHVTMAAAAVNLAEMTGGEIGIGMDAASTVKYKAGWSIVQLPSDAAQGASFDCALSFSNQAGAIGWKDIILIGNQNGAYPGSTTGNILRTIGGTAANGIDISNTTINTFAWKSNAATIDGAGNFIGNTWNKLTITAPASSATLTIANGKTLTANSSLTLAGTDGKTLTVSNSGTLAGGDAFTLAVAAGKTLTANSSLTLAGTDSKTLTVSNSGTLSGGDAFVLSIAAGKTLTASNTLTFTGTDSSSVAFGAGGTVAYTANKLSVFAATTSAELAGVISDETGTGVLVFGTAPTFTTSIISPIVYGGSVAGSQLTLQSTSNGSPSGDSILLRANGATHVTINSSGITASSGFFPGAGSFTSGTAQIYTTSGGGSNGLTIIPKTSSGTNDFGFFSAAGAELLTNTAGTNNFKFCGGAGSEDFAGAHAYFSGIGTTASAANAFLNSGSTPTNELLRSTSSLRYKRNIEPIDHKFADAILGLQPIWYRSSITTDRQDWAWYGLGAEDVAKVDPRLVHWGYPDEAWETVQHDGLEGEPRSSERRLKAGAEMVPDGVMYERVAVLLLDIVKRQEDRLAALEAAALALTGKHHD